MRKKVEGSPHGTWHSSTTMPGLTLRKGWGQASNLQHVETWPQSHPHKGLKANAGVEAKVLDLLHRESARPNTEGHSCLRSSSKLGPATDTKSCS